MLSEFDVCRKYIDQYDSLNVVAKINCLEQFVNVVLLPFDTYDFRSIKEVEGSIFYTLSDPQYSIDNNGNWLCEGVPMRRKNGGDK